MRMLGRYIEHPNVGAVMVIELGCEKTNLYALGKHVTPSQATSGGVRSARIISSSNSRQSSRQTGRDAERAGKRWDGRDDPPRTGVAPGASRRANRAGRTRLRRERTGGGTEMRRE